MQISEFLTLLKYSEDTVTFDQTMTVVDQHYDYSPTAFTNGEVQNPAGVNEGSCKVFAFAMLHKLSAGQALACFGDYYRKDVLDNPQGTNHGNIRSFIKNGWPGVTFAEQPLTLKSSGESEWDGGRPSAFTP